MESLPLIKSLGVLTDKNLTWSNHINAISKKISSGIGSIKRISRCVPPATLHNIYHGLVQSHFDYCSVVWGNCAKTLSDKLQRLQIRPPEEVSFLGSLKSAF